MDNQTNINFGLEYIASKTNWDLDKKRQLIQEIKNEQKLDVNDRFRVLLLGARWIASKANRVNTVVPLGVEVLKCFGLGHPQSLSTLVKKKVINALWAMNQGGYVEGEVDRQVEIVTVTHWILSQLLEEDDGASYELCNQVRSQLANFLSHCIPSRLGPALAVSRLIKMHPCCLFSKEHITKGNGINGDDACEEVVFFKNDEDDEQEMKVCEALIKCIGALTIPTPDVINLETFAGQVREVAEAVALIWCQGRSSFKGKHSLEEEEKRVFQSLQIIHSLVSDSGKDWRDLCPALASILQLVPLRLIPGAVTGVLGSSNGGGGSGEGAVAAMLCNLLCDWLLRWPGAINLSHWILALLKGLSPPYPANAYTSYSSNDTNNNRRASQAACESRVRILVNLTIANIEKLVEGLNDPSLCYALLPVVSHMLLGFQHSPVPFLKICPHLPPLLSRLRDEREDGVPGSAESLQLLVDLCSMLLYLHGGSDPTREHLREALKECPLPSIGVPNHEYLLWLRWMPLSNRTYGSYEYSFPPQIPSLVPPEWIPTVYHTTSRAGHIGLSNLGNTCYANSVLQALFMTTRFRQRVLSSSAPIPPGIGTIAGPSIWDSGTIGAWGRVSTGNVPAPKTRPLLSHLRVLFALLSHSPKPALSPKAILAAVSMAGGQFEIGQQHDCSEFMCFFLDALHEQGKAYAQHHGKDSEEDNDDDRIMFAELENHDGDGESEEKANSTQEEEEDADMDEDEAEEEDMREGAIGMKRWTTEEDLSSSEGRRLQTKRKALSLAEFSSVAANETDAGQDLDEKISEVVESDGIAQSSAQALSDSHSDSTDSGIQSVGEEDVTAVMSASANLQGNEERVGKTDKQPSESSKGIKKGSLWTENGDVGKLKKEFCSLVQQEFGGVAHTMHQCLSCGSVSVRADPFRDLQLSFPEDSDEVSSENLQEQQGFIGPLLPQHMLPTNEIEKEEKEEKDLIKSKDSMEVEDKVSSIKKRHSGPWGVSDLLGHYLSTETLCGENRYRCTKCKGLQDARRSVSLAWPPPRHLLLTLKHFRFDRNTARRSKALRPLKVELNLEVPVALTRSHRSNAAKRRKTRSAQTGSEDDHQEEKIHASVEENSRIEIKEVHDKEDGMASCSNITDAVNLKESCSTSCNDNMPLEKSGSDLNAEEGESVGTQENTDSSSFSRRRRRVRKEEEGASVGLDERLYTEERRVTYRLYAVIVHSGISLDGGHYYTYARRPRVSDGVDGEEEWCMLNDRQVSPQSGPESFCEPSGHRPQDTPYVLFYMLEGMNNANSPDWWSLPAELREAVEADGSNYVRKVEDWKRKHSCKARPSGSYNPRDGDDPPPSSCGGGLGGGFSSMGGHFVF